MGEEEAVEPNASIIPAKAYRPRPLVLRSYDPARRIYHFHRQFATHTSPNNFLNAVKWSPDGSSFLSSSDDNILRLFNFKSDTSLASASYADDSFAAKVVMREGEAIHDFCWYPNMPASDRVTIAFATTTRDHPIHLWDATLGQVHCTYEADGAMDASSIAFNPAGTRIIAGYNECIRMFDLQRSGRDCELYSTVKDKKEGLRGVISAMAFAPSHTGILALGSYSQTAAIYKEDNMELLHLLHGQEGGVTHVQFSRDGNYLYTGGRKDPYIRCWDVRKAGDYVYKLYRSTGNTNQRILFDIDPSGQHLATGSQNGLVHIYGLQTGDQVSRFQAALDTVNCFSFHPFLPYGVSSSGHRRFVVPDDSNEELHLSGLQNCISVWSFCYDLSMENLPLDLVSYILSWLPAKDLMKCKFLCKEWFRLLTDPHFIINHHYVNYNNLIRTQDERFLVIYTPFRDFFKPHFSLYSLNVDPQKWFELWPFDPLELNSDHWFGLLGPCNGLYFLQGVPSLVMTNLYLSQVKVLPESPFSTTKMAIHTHRFPGFGFDPKMAIHTRRFPGFGFDPKTNDYKVVLLWLKGTDEKRCIECVELYSLNSNSWRKLDDAIAPIQISKSQVYAYVQNCCHWFGYVDQYGVKEYVVLAFDMVKESFRKIKLPKILHSSEADFATLAPFNESATISVIAAYLTGGTKKLRFEVWVMKDYRDKWSWTKQYTVGPLKTELPNTRVVGLYGSNKLLLSSNSERFLLYDPDSDDKPITNLQCYGNQSGTLLVASYMESLVSLQR